MSTFKLKRHNNSKNTYPILVVKKLHLKRKLLFGKNTFHSYPPYSAIRNKVLSKLFIKNNPLIA